MSYYESWDLAIQTMIGIGGLLVAACAIWGPQIRSKLAGPRLMITLNNPQGELTNFNNAIPVRYYHLKISNIRKSSPAHNTRALLTKVYERQLNGELIDRSFSGPLQLTWQFPTLTPQYQRIGPDFLCDIGLIRSDAPFEFSLYLTPNCFDKSVIANKDILVEVVAVADNAQSEPAFFNIKWDGEWHTDSGEMNRHLVIKPIKSINSR